MIMCFLRIKNFEKKYSIPFRSVNYILCHVTQKYCCHVSKHIIAFSSIVRAYLLRIISFSSIIIVSEKTHISATIRANGSKFPENLGS